MNKTCYVRDCLSKVHSKGLCGKHYHRFVRYGDTSVVKIFLNDEIKRFWSKVDKRGANECWNWTRGKHHGYGNFHVRKNGVDTVVVSTRYSWELVNGKIPDGLLVCHKCDNRSCVNPNHLFLGTYADNATDRDIKNRFVKLEGEHNGFSKLTNKDVIEIRNADISKYGSVTKLAQKYGISKPHLYRIIARKVWKHV